MSVSFNLEPEIETLLSAYDGDRHVLVNRLLGDYFTTEPEIKLRTENGEYVINNKLEFPPECNHPEHAVFNYCPYTPEFRRQIGDKPLPPAAPSQKGGER